MSKFNQFQLYCATQSGSVVFRDDCTLVQNEVDSITEYAEVKNFVDKHFNKVKKAGDVEVKQFKNSDKRILCQMFEDETIFFLIKSNSASEPEWTSIKIKN